MYTLQSIKDIYYIELYSGNIRDTFAEYLRENYERVYDKRLNFIGYESAWSNENE